MTKRWLKTHPRETPEDLLRRARDQRRAPTRAEAALWSALRRRQLSGAKFRRQHPIGCFIVDFFCPEVRLAIEIDGEVHARDEVSARDERRSHALERLDVVVMRFTTSEVLESLEAVVTAIGARIVERRTGRIG
jgi:very-short-patch-repair endonuclease